MGDFTIIKAEREMTRSRPAAEAKFSAWVVDRSRRAAQSAELAAFQAAGECRECGSFGDPALAACEVCGALR